MRWRESFISFYTLFHREATRIFRIWGQSLLPSVISTWLYFVIFGSIMGARIGDVNGVPYIEYIVPGLVMLGIINNAYICVVFSLFSNKFQRCIEEMLVAPMPNAAIIAGYVAGGVLRGMLVGTLVIILALFFTKLHIAHWFLTIFIAVLTAAFLSLAGFVNGVFAKKWDDLSIIPEFILTPLTYLGGVFYSIDFLPESWNLLTRVNPIFYMVSGFRYAMLGFADVDIKYALTILITGVILLYVFCLWLLRKGIGMKN
jgi:ABC-2 type transport system permease protein